MKNKKKRKEKQYYTKIINKLKIIMRKHNNKDYMKLSELCDLLHVQQEIVLKEPLPGRAIECPDNIKIISFDNNMAQYLYEDKKYSAHCSSLLVKF